MNGENREGKMGNKQRLAWIIGIISVLMYPPILPVAIIGGLVFAFNVD